MTKISQLSSIGDSLAIGDQFLIRDIDDTGSPNKSVTVSGITRALDTGTALAPAIAFAGDKNTGIYSPAADQLAISTNGTGRLFVGNGGVRLNTDTADSVSIFTVNGSSDSTFGIGVNNIYTATSNTFFAYRHLQNGTLLGGLFWQNSTSSLIRYSALNGIAFHTGSGVEGEERLRLDSSGRLLVGTSSARTMSTIGAPALFEVESSTNASLSATRTANDAFASTLVLAKVREAAIVSNNDEVGLLSFEGHDGTAHIRAAAITAQIDGTPGTNDMPGRLVFFTTADGASSPTERMRIDSSGDVQIGTTTPLARLTIEKAFAGGAAVDTNTTTASTTYSAAVFRHNGNISGSIAVSTTATTYATSSDYRLKENVTAVTDGITRLQQLNPSRFNFIADPDRTVDGFIAHEVQDIVPECVTGEKDAVDDEGNPVYQGIDQSKLVPLLTAALQEAIGRIETLEARLTAAGID